jgi:hypothetical protein
MEILRNSPSDSADSNKQNNNAFRDCSGSPRKICGGHMDRETEKRTEITGAAFKLLIHWLRHGKCTCEVRVRLKLEGLCHFCRDNEKFKKAFPLEWAAACEFVVLNPREPKK